MAAARVGEMLAQGHCSELDQTGAFHTEALTTPSLLLCLGQSKHCIWLSISDYFACQSAIFNLWHKIWDRLLLEQFWKLWWGKYLKNHSTTRSHFCLFAASPGFLFLGTFSWTSAFHPRKQGRSDSFFLRLYFQSDIFGLKSYFLQEKSCCCRDKWNLVRKRSRSTDPC